MPRPVVTERLLMGRKESIQTNKHGRNPKDMFSRDVAFIVDVHALSICGLKIELQTDFFNISGGYSYISYCKL